MRYVLVVLLIGLFNSGVRASTRPMTLKGAVQFALDNSPSFNSAKKTQAIRELEYKSSIYKMLPSLDFTTINGLQNNIPIASDNTLLEPNPTSPWYSSLNLGLTENLYDNGVSLTNLKIADLKRDLALVAGLKSRDTLTLDVTTEFYKFSLASALLEVRKQQQAILDKQFKTLSSQYQQGFKTKSDFLRLKTQVQRAEIDEVTAENTIALSVAELRKLLGVGLNNDEPIVFEPLQVKKEQRRDSYFPKRAPNFENVYDYKITKIQNDINEKSVDLIKRNYWPQALISAGATYSNLNYINSPTSFPSNNQLSWNALLTIQYNIWDWGTRKHDIEIAEYNRDIQNNSLTDDLLGTKAKITSLMADLDRISRNYSLTQELLSLEEQSNKNLETQYREGKVTYLDLITSLHSLLDAKVQFFSAYFDSLESLAKYEYYEGRIYDFIFEK